MMASGLIRTWTRWLPQQLIPTEETERDLQGAQATRAPEFEDDADEQSKSVLKWSLVRLGLDRNARAAD